MVPSSQDDTISFKLEYMSALGLDAFNVSVNPLIPFHLFVSSFWTSTNLVLLADPTYPVV